MLGAGGPGKVGLNDWVFTGLYACTRVCFVTFPNLGTRNPFQSQSYITSSIRLFVIGG